MTTEQDGGWQISEAHAAQLRVCEGILSTAYEVLESFLPTQEAREARALIAAFYARSATTFEAVLILCGNGFGEQGLMLTRSLFEDMVDAHWASLHWDEALERAREHQIYSAHLRYESATRYPELLPDASPPAQSLSAEERKVLDRRFRGGTGSWTGVGLSERLRLIEPMWPNPESRKLFRFFADLPHKLANETLHPTAWGLSQLMSFSVDEEGTGRLHFRAGASDHFITQALYGAYFLFVQMLTLIMDVFEHPERDAMEKRFAEESHVFVQLSPEVLRKTGRNDPCPCGSGKNSRSAMANSPARTRSRERSPQTEPWPVERIG